jgi:hypothetical protein
MHLADRQSVQQRRRVSDQAIYALFGPVPE